MKSQKMRLTLNCVFFLIFVAVLNFVSTTTEISFDDLDKNGQKLALQILTPSIVRIMVMPGANVEATKSPPFAVPEKNWAPVPFSKTSNGDETIISITNGLSITVNTSSLSLSFCNQNGDVVLQETNRKYFSNTKKYPNTYTVQQSFKSHSDDIILGGGSFQNGYLGLRGSPLLLQQRNTESVTPFFVSSSGFGLLWDNSGPTWLNPIDEFGENLDIGGSRHTGVTHASTYFTANSFGDHFFTLSCPSVTYGDSIAATANVTLYPDGEHEFIKAISWNNMKNKPPTLSGKVSNMIPGLKYKVEVTCENCCIPFHKNFDTGDLQLYVSRPPSCTGSEKAHGQTTIRSDLATFLDYYVIVPSVPSSMKTSTTSTVSSSVKTTLFDSCIKGYRMLTGTASMLPKWSLGFWQSKEHYGTQEELLSAAQEFRSRKIPVDAIVQDWKYWGDLGWSPQWDPTYYPDPEGMVKSLHAMNLHFMVSVWCKFENVSAYLKPLEEAGQLIDKTNWLDIYQPKAQQSLYEFANSSMYSIGVDSLWLDATEPEGLPSYDKTVYPWGKAKSNGVSGTSVINTYSLAVTESITSALMKDYSDKRIFHLTRSFFAGQQRVAGVLWSGDISGVWDMLRRQITCSLNFAASGSPYWSMDTGGFFRPEDQYNSSDYHELLTRWFQLAAFVPITRYHGQGGELWQYGEKVTKTVNKTLTLRYRCMPYIYSLARQVAQEDYTMQRPFVFDFLHDRVAVSVEDAFMFGPVFLVSPIVARNVSMKETYLPTHRTNIWIDFATGKKYPAGQSVNVNAPIETGLPPLFCKGGSILPLGPALQWVGNGGSSKENPLEIRIYPGGAVTFELYEDGGEDNTYKTSNSYFAAELSWKEETASSGVFTIGAQMGNGYEGMPSWPRTIKVLVVSENHGVGLDEIGEDSDATLLYSGSQLSVKLSI